MSDGSIRAGPDEPLGPKLVGALLFLLTLVVAGVITGGYFFWKSDMFQKRFYPQDYWAQKIQDRQGMIDFTTSLMRDTVLDLKKLEYSLTHHREWEIASRRPSGVAEPEATRIAVDDVAQELAALRSQAQMWADQLEQSRMNLLEAQTELAKAKR